MGTRCLRRPIHILKQVQLAANELARFVAIVGCEDASVIPLVLVRYEVAVDRARLILTKLKASIERVRRLHILEDVRCAWRWVQN